MTKKNSIQFDSEVDTYVEQVHASLANFAENPSPSDFRRWTSELFAGQGDPINSVNTRYIEIPTRHGTLRAKLYLPESQEPSLLVYMHGGGFVVGDIEGLDFPLHRLSHEAGIAVMSLDYALAPEHAYPVAIEQCQDAMLWASENRTNLGVGEGLGVAGDSAGGNIAALLALRAREEGYPKLNWQGMLNPVLDFPAIDSLGTESHRLFAQGPILSNEVMQYFNHCYFAGHDEQRAKKEASPVLCEDLTGLPPAFIGVGEYDPLRDDAVAYGESLKSAGVRTTIRVFDGLVHNFVAMTHISQRADAAFKEFVTAADEALNPRNTSS